MYFLVVLVHLVVCFVLILVILLQAGRGGGLSDMFGGAMTQNQKLFGSETNTFLAKATSYSAILFLITCVSLSVITTSRGKSLMRAGTLAPAIGTPAAAPQDPSAAPPAIPLQEEVKPAPQAAGEAAPKPEESSPAAP